MSQRLSPRSRSGSRDRRRNQNIVDEDHLLEQFNQSRLDLNEAQQTHDFLRSKIVRLLDANRTNAIGTRNYQAVRFRRNRESMTKNTTPPDIWQRYKHTTPVDYINVTRI
jgi:hypothetical protein